LYGSKKFRRKYYAEFIKNNFGNSFWQRQEPLPISSMVVPYLKSLKLINED